MTTTATRKRATPNKPIIQHVQKKLRPSDITIVPGVQSRLIDIDEAFEGELNGQPLNVPISPFAVSKLIESMEAGLVLPPIDVVFDGKRYILARGNTRYAAHITLNNDNPIDVNVHQGNVITAAWLSIGSNMEHGNRRNNYDLQHEIAQILLNPDLAIENEEPLSMREIARRTRATHQTVSNMIKRIQDLIWWQMKGAIDEPPAYKPQWLIGMIQRQLVHIPAHVMPKEPYLEPQKQQAPELPPIQGGGIKLKIVDELPPLKQRPPAQPQVQEDTLPPIKARAPQEQPEFAATEQDEDDYELDQAAGSVPESLAGKIQISQLTVTCVVCRGGEEMLMRYGDMVKDITDEAQNLGWIQDESEYWICPNCTSK